MLPTIGRVDGRGIRFRFDRHTAVIGRIHQTFMTVLSVAIRYGRAVV
jgi:hypothetical protein